MRDRGDDGTSSICCKCVEVRAIDMMDEEEEVVVVVAAASEIVEVQERSPGGSVSKYEDCEPIILAGSGDLFQSFIVCFRTPWRMLTYTIIYIHTVIKQMMKQRKKQIEAIQNVLSMNLYHTLWTSKKKPKSFPWSAELISTHVSTLCLLPFTNDQRRSQSIHSLSAVQLWKHPASRQMSPVAFQSLS